MPMAFVGSLMIGSSGPRNECVRYSTVSQNRNPPPRRAGSATTPSSPWPAGSDSSTEPSGLTISRPGLPSVIRPIRPPARRSRWPNSGTSRGTKRYAGPARAFGSTVASAGGALLFGGGAAHAAARRASVRTPNRAQRTPIMSGHTTTRAYPSRPPEEAAETEAPVGSARRSARGGLAGLGRLSHSRALMALAPERAQRLFDRANRGAPRLRHVLLAGKERQRRIERAPESVARTGREHQDFEHGIAQKSRERVIHGRFTQELGARVTSQVSLGAEVDQLQTGDLRGLRQIGEVDVGGEILAAGWRVRVVRPRHVVWRRAIDAEREISAPCALQQAPGGVSVVECEDEAVAHRRGELGDEFARVHVHVGHDARILGGEG